MEWGDIAGIVFACVTANHLGLVKAIEDTFEKELPIINCVKCFSFWSVLVYMAFATHEVITSLAVSFLSGYAAIWLELLEGYIDTLYVRLYGKIIRTDGNDTDTADTEHYYSEGAVSDMRKEN